MARRTNAQRPMLDYHELKMSGRFSPESIELLVDTAAAITLRRKYNPQIQVPIENLQLYDVEHRDTGTERSLSKSHENIPVYETIRMPLSRQAVIGSLALTGITVDRLGGSSPAIYSAYGVVGIGSLDIITAYKAEIQTVLARNKIVQILGDITGGADNFGDPTPYPPPNENFDTLVSLGTFLDNRFDERGREIKV